MMRALSVSGCNASMGRIVATPTAGSCGIMPGCLLTLMEDKGMDRKDVVMSMFTAAASEWSSPRTPASPAPKAAARQNAAARPA
mgnify:CR=1 FL=1